MKKCVFENLKGDFFFFLMHLSSCLLLFEAINNQNFPVSSALLLSLISLSLFSSFQILSHCITWLVLKSRILENWASSWWRRSGKRETKRQEEEAQAFTTDDANVTWRLLKASYLPNSAISTLSIGLCLSLSLGIFSPPPPHTHPVKHSTRNRSQQGTGWLATIGRTEAYAGEF